MDDLTAAIERAEAWCAGEDFTFGMDDAAVLIAAARASQEAAAELDALKHDIARYVAIAAEQATELSALKAERDVLRKNDERYRWLRVRLSDEEIGDVAWATEGLQTYSSVLADTVDSAIDAALAESAPDKEGK